MSIPEEVIKRVRSHVNNDLAYCTSAWQVYEATFGRSELRVALLNESSDEWFGLAQRALQQMVLLGLRRLLDRPAYGQNRNLSVRWLIDHAGLPRGEQSKRDVKHLCEKYKQGFEKVVVMCDKELAHSDAAIRETVKTIRRPSRREIGDSLGGLSEIMNVINVDADGAHFIHDMPLFDSAADNLVRRLVLGKQGHDEIMRAWKHGGRHGPPPFPALP